MSEADILRRLAAIEQQLRQPIEIPQYDIGTWTPTFVGTSTAGAYTYTKQIGNWTRIGDRLIFNGCVAISAIGTPPVGNMTITGLPFASSSADRTHGGIWFVYVANFNYAANSLALLGRIVPGTTVITLAEVFDNAAMVAAPAANFTNASCDLIFNGMYLL